MTQNSDQDKSCEEDIRVSRSDEQEKKSQSETSSKKDMGSRNAILITGIGGLLTAFSALVAAILGPEGIGVLLKSLNDGGVETLSEECRLLSDRGERQFRDGFLGEARRSYEEVTAKCPTYTEGWRNLGNFYYQQGDYKQSSQAFQQAYELAPDDTVHKHNLASVYIARNFPEEAISLLKEVIQKEPDNMRARYNLGLALQMIGEISEMKNQYEKVIYSGEDIPRAESSAFNLAWEYAARATNCGSEEAREAITLLQQSLELAGKMNTEKERLEKMIETKKSDDDHFATLRSCPDFIQLISN